MTTVDNCHGYAEPYMRRCLPRSLPHLPPGFRSL